MYCQNLHLCFSQYYTRFKSYCCEAYNILRKSSSLILNLFKLMERSGIPDISADESGGLKVNLGFTSWVSALQKQSKWHVLCFCGASSISSRRNSGWIWMMRRLYISSRILSMKVSALCSLKWLRPSIDGLSIGDRLTTHKSSTNLYMVSWLIFPCCHDTLVWEYDTLFAKGINLNFFLLVLLIPAVLLTNNRWIVYRL